MNIDLESDGESFEIPGRGTVIPVKNPQLPELWNPSLLFTYDEVKIDGKPVHIRGIEKFCIYISETSPYKLPFAILV